MVVGTRGEGRGWGRFKHECNGESYSVYFTCRNTVKKREGAKPENHESVVTKFAPGIAILIKQHFEHTPATSSRGLPEGTAATKQLRKIKIKWNQMNAERNMRKAVVSGLMRRQDCNYHSVHCASLLRK